MPQKWQGEARHQREAIGSTEKETSMGGLRVRRVCKCLVGIWGEIDA